MASMSLAHWQTLLRRLIDEHLLTSIDPKSVREEFLQGGMSDTELELVCAGVTKPERMYRLHRFLKTRPSLAEALSKALARVHRPLYQVLQEAMSELTPFEDRQRFQAALNHLHEELEIVGQWALPKLLAVKCLEESEVERINSKETSLAKVLAERSPVQQRALVEFLMHEHYDLLNILRCVYDGASLDFVLSSSTKKEEKDTLPFRTCRSMTSVQESVVGISERERFDRDVKSLKSRILELESIRDAMMDDNQRLLNDNASLRQKVAEFEIKESEIEIVGHVPSDPDAETHSIFLVNKTGHGPHGKIFLDLPSPTKIKDIRQKIAQLLGTDPDKTSLEQFVGINPDNGERQLLVWDDKERWMFMSIDGSVASASELVHDKQIESLELDDAEMCFSSRYSLYFRADQRPSSTSSA